MTAAKQSASIRRSFEPRRSGWPVPVEAQHADRRDLGMTTETLRSGSNRPIWTRASARMA